MEVEHREALVRKVPVPSRKKYTDGAIVTTNRGMELAVFVTIACQQVVFRRIRVRYEGCIGLLGPRDESKGW